MIVLHWFSSDCDVFPAKLDGQDSARPSGV